MGDNGTIVGNRKADRPSKRPLVQMENLIDSIGTQPVARHKLHAKGEKDEPGLVYIVFGDLTS